MSYALIGVIAALLLLLLLVIKIFKSPMKIILKFVLNTALGFTALIILNYFGGKTGVYLGTNLVNAVVIGVLGVPGLGLLLLLRWLMIT